MIISLFKVCIIGDHFSYSSSFFLQLICCAKCMSQLCKKHFEIHYQLWTILLPIFSFKILVECTSFYLACLTTKQAILWIYYAIQTLMQEFWCSQDCQSLITIILIIPLINWVCKRGRAGNNLDFIQNYALFIHTTKHCNGRFKLKNLSEAIY